jgi:hypothetical protein
VQFLVRARFGGEVITPLGTADTNTYYGAPPATGLWQLNHTKLEDFIAPALAPLSFGQSVRSFMFAFELADLMGWGEWFTKTENYISFRRTQNLLISVGQVDWLQVKDLAADRQYEHLMSALDAALARVQQMKRKPKDFESQRFVQAVRDRMSQCSIQALISSDA